ncbi:50S ribosomal subunit L30 [Bimuria novae-zelandiae CBS 107.79]|uniref:Large ribosomal subunit protein mL46 n=1 Tax=Bimuria novae-zelandiae CBS 107.79 TaxID=1447943 RepID=A0A6A5V765_9PLEO|nr:50S ribosomal subunit L30 [Bimuria novae-zelandiae CBS 107.79]
MNAGHQTTRRLAAGAGKSICRSCRDSLSRNYASAAAAAVQTEDHVSQHIPPVAQASPQTSYQVNAGVVLSRPPQITRDLHPFESAFFLYQRRLNERSALPFTRYFYYKERTPADREWKRKIKQRLTPARDIGRYKGYGEEAWNDEVLVGAKESDFNWQVERLLEDAETTGVEDQPAQELTETTPSPLAQKKVEHEAVERPMSRITEADKKNDVKSLNRLLQRTLYFLVKNKEGQWMFPQDGLQKETLKEAAHRVLEYSAGVNMNTWIVGNVPIGHYQLDYPTSRKTESGLNELGLKTFFMKARIMAGQANLKENQFGLQDFQWLAKEEVKTQVEDKYWRSIKNMLAER